MEDFSKYAIKDYKYWQVQIFSNQGYLGRCLVWCKREDALDLSNATEEEQKELFVILKDVEMALSKTFKPDIINYSFLGNDTHHLHGHIVPRYSKPIEFNGATFVDKNFGHNWKTDHDFITSPELLEAVKVKLSNNFA